MKDKFNNQFATQRLRLETTTTTGPVAGSATMTSGNADFYTTKKKKTKKETKDVEPKLAAGKAKVYPKNKWGWKEAPSIPNRPSKGGFIYKQLFETENKEPEIGDKVKRGKIEYEITHIADNGMYILKNPDGFTSMVTKDDIMRSNADLKTEMKVAQLNFEPTLQVIEQVAEELGLDMENVMQGEIKMYSDVSFSITNIPNQAINSFSVILSTDESEFIVDAPNHARLRIPNKVFTGSLNENYSRFKKETKTRTNEQQLHTAMRLTERKIHEANRILEYTSKLRTELTETRVNKNTQRLMERITKGIAEAYGKMKKLK